MVSRDTSFDKRVVRYEEIHAIQHIDFAELIRSAQIHNARRILDCGCGYGAVTREVLRFAECERQRSAVNLTITLIDESAVQIERAKSELQPWLSSKGVALNFVKGTFPQDLTVGSLAYDVIICKMVLHEVAKDEQSFFLRSVHDCLNRGGRLVFWDLCLAEETANFYRDVIRLKDSLAGFETMVQRRNFLTESELRGLFANSPFGSFELVKEISYRFDTQRRLISEFGGDQSRFNQWHDFIRRSAERINPAILKQLEYHDGGDSISFHVRKIIGLANRLSD